MKKILIFLSVLFLSGTAQAQHLMGYVSGKDDKQSETLAGASVWWAGTSLATFSDSAGHFHIAFPDSLPAKLVVSFIGYKNDTLVFKDRNKTEVRVMLQSSRNLKEVTVTGKTAATQFSTIDPRNSELITRKELTKAACCNLAESFETNASVDVNYTDAVSGAKQIQMLGLDGIYTQILSENLPLIRGLSSSYGLNFVPGPWVESILVSKGAGSVVNGYESITGQLNIELLEPDNADRFFFNAYANHEGRLEGNMHLAKRFGKNTSSLLFLHASDMGNKLDHNEDGFLDMPLTRQYNALNRWHFQKEGKFEGQLGIKAMMEDRNGGQTDFEYNRDFPDTLRFGVGISNQQVETFTKTGFLFPDKPYKSIALTTSERYHRQEMYFGHKSYSGEQTSLNVNGIWQGIIGNTFHKIKSGPSFSYDHYKEQFRDSSFSREDMIPGVYSEYTYSRNDTTISVVLGARADYHSRFGLKLTPRLHLKYNFNPRSAIRLSAGSGWRTANIFVENTQVFANQRQVLIREELKPEEAWNYGLSFTHKFMIGGRDCYLSSDFFRTDFMNQAVVDLEDPDKVLFYNLDGKSYSNSFQVEVGAQPTESIDLKAAFKHYDVKATYSGVLKDKPMVPRDRALFNIAWISGFEDWKINATVKWFGRARMPDTSSNPKDLQQSAYAPSYFSFSAQVTKIVKQLELYLGGENLGNYMVMDAIIDPAHPFGEYFDASLIAGPSVGVLFYGGLRISVK